MYRLFSYVLLIAAALCVTALGFEAVAEFKFSGDVGAVPSRDEIMTCAQNWVDRKVPYCQCNGAAECCGSCPYCGTYRCDCSGYVTYCLQLPAGLNTNSLPSHATEITKDALQKGDFMDCAGDHVVFFAGWTDSSKKSYVVYQEPGCHTSGVHHAYKSVITYPFGEKTCFKPYRRTGLAAISEKAELSAADGPSASGESIYASEADLKEAFLNVPNTVGHTDAQSAKVMEEVRAHGKALGYFTF